MKVNIRQYKNTWSVSLDAPPAHEVFLRRFSGVVEGKGPLHQAVSMAYDLAEALGCKFEVIKEEVGK